MPAFALTQTQRDLVDQTRDVATTELAGIAANGVPGKVDRVLLAALGRHGLLARMVGSSARRAAAMDLCLLRESLATVSTAAETALALQGLGSYPFLLFGSDEVIARWRDGVLSGDAVAAFALSEPEAGSDAGALALRAEPEADGWRLYGEKTW
ncbi:MAG TPA: acyl-CoA dehydrogenase family protein, partial [Candidatus Nanopelagicales bacterium]